MKYFTPILIYLITITLIFSCSRDLHPEETDGENDAEVTETLNSTTGLFMFFDDNYDYWYFIIGISDGVEEDFIYNPDEDDTLDKVIDNWKTFIGTKITVYWVEMELEEAGSGEMIKRKVAVKVDIE